MNKQYTYRLDVNHFPRVVLQIYLKIGLIMTSYKPIIYNTNVSYNYSNNSFNITWDALDTSNFATGYILKN